MRTGCMAPIPRPISQPTTHRPFHFSSLIPTPASCRLESFPPGTCRLQSSWILTLLGAILGYSLASTRHSNGFLVVQSRSDEGEGKTCRSGLWGPAAALSRNLYGSIVVWSCMHDPLGSCYFHCYILGMYSNALGWARSAHSACSFTCITCTT